MAKREIVFATGNAGKLKEARDVLAKRDITLIAPVEIENQQSVSSSTSDSPQTENFQAPTIVEDGSSYIENARIKAKAVYTWCKLPTFADDSGLEVTALGGAPGLYSARYAGTQANKTRNIAKLLSVMSTTQERSARFRCVIVFTENGRNFSSVEGMLNGSITEAPRGTGGFGYDSVFEVDGYGQTLAELKGSATAVKTHRVCALEALIGLL